MGRGLIVDGWLRLRGWARIGVLVSRLRMLLDEALQARIDNPALVFGTGTASGPVSGSGFGFGTGERVIEAVKRLIEFNGLDQ